MVHLNTNILIGLVSDSRSMAKLVGRLLSENEDVGVSAITWAEFMNGPVTARARHLANATINENFFPFCKDQAELAATLFNLSGRRRSSRQDCMIAAAAIISNSSLATFNTPDFDRFTSHGLTLVDLPS